MPASVGIRAVLSLAWVLVACAPRGARVDAATGPGAVRPFQPGAGAVRVWSKEADPNARRAYDGVVSAVEAAPDDPATHVVVLQGGALRRTAQDDQRDLGVASVAEPDRFRVDLPSGIALPIAVGDRLHAELWTVRVGFSAWDEHARVMRGRDALILVNELPDDWSAAPGERRTPPGDQLVVEHAVAISVRGKLLGQVAGWGGATVDGVEYALFGHFTTLDPEQAQRQGPPSDWADIFSVELVRLRP